LGAKITGFFTVAIIALLPFAHATPSGLTYLDSTYSTDEGEGGEIIAINPNGSILASVHGNELIFFNTSTLDKIGQVYFGEDIMGMEFNPNGSLLAINKRSTVTLKESIKLINVSSMNILDSSVLADDKFKDISWSIDGTILAAQGNDGDVEQYRIPSLFVKNTLAEIHVVDVKCIDYRSDGQYVLTGDESGRWAVWNLQGELQGSYKTYSEGLVDCQFSPDGSDIVLLGENGKFTSKIFGGSEKHTETIIGAKQIIFSNVSNRMHVSVESESFRGLISYDYNSFTPLTNTTFFHKVEDVAILEKDNGRIQSLFVAGGTGEIAVYLRELIPKGFNEPGVDLDGDFVPDDLDPDDDGDGIIDDWDDDFGCDAPEGTPCSRYPDLNKIRSVEIFVGEFFVVSDQITLPTEDSSHIRNLSRSAIAKDNAISYKEVDLFSKAMCQNMNHGDIIDRWRESIVLSNGELGSATVSCEIISGMELIRDGDSTTQISMLIRTTFNYSSKVSLPLEISLIEQPLPTDGSIAWLAPSHPISLKFDGEGVEENEIPLWWNDGNNIAKVTINQVSIKSPSFVERIADLALHPIAFVLYLAIIAGAITTFLRWSNRIEFDLEDENEFDTQDDLEPIEESLEDIEEIDDTAYIIDRDNEFDNIIEPIMPVKSPPRKKREMYRTTEQKSPLVKKKRVSTSSRLNKDGPITKTKRKRLIDEDDFIDDIYEPKSPTKIPEPKIKKRKVKLDNDLSQPEKNTVTRKKKVKQENTTPGPELKSEKKKRKPVKRKQKSKLDTKSDSKEQPQSKDSHKIDEDKLQDSLMDDFTTVE